MNNPKGTALSAMNLDDMRRMIEEADENGDNELQRDEFVKFFCGGGDRRITH